MTSHYIRTSKTQCSLCWTKDNTEPAFYYHGDHLGSASYVTASNGEVVQTLNYLPYGEDWVDDINLESTSSTARRKTLRQVTTTTVQDTTTVKR